MPCGNGAGRRPYKNLTKRARYFCGFRNLFPNSGKSRTVLKITTSFIALCTCLALACKPGGEKAAAHPPKPPRFGETARTFRPINIAYADTNTAQWRATRDRLDSFYRVQTRAGFNGSVLIGYKGHVLYERYFGFADKAAGRNWSPTSPSQLASTSKTFTGAAVLFLAQRGYLDLDAPVKEYLPGFPYTELTPRMLLNHRSGLPDYLKWVPAIRKGNAPLYNPELVQLFIKHKPALEFKINSRFKYSNSNYAMLASIIEAVTEMKYADFMKQYIFDGVGLRNTYVYDPANGLPPNATVSYKANWAVEPVTFSDGVYGDKGIYSTVQDMYRWDQSFYKQLLIDSNTQQVAYAPCSFEKPGVKNYGLGWRMLCYEDGYKVVYHNGWWHGNNTCFYRFIQDNFTIIVLGNKYTGSIYRQPPVVYNIVQGRNESRKDFGGED